MPAAIVLAMCHYISCLHLFAVMTESAFYRFKELLALLNLLVNRQNLLVRSPERLLLVVVLDHLLPCVLTLTPVQSHCVDVLS